MESLREQLGRRQKEKDVDLRRLKKADLQLKAARDNLQAVQKKYLNKKADVSSCCGRVYGLITSKIKHAIKLKTSPARLVQLLQPSIAFCFSLQPMTAHRPVRRHWLQAKTKC